MTEGRAFNFLAWLTGLVVVGYIGVSGYAFATSAATWAEFSGAVGPLAGALLGYWLRGAQT